MVKIAQVNRQRLRLAAQQILARNPSGLMPCYSVNEFPKSGGTWLCQMLAEGLGIPYVSHSFPPLKSSVFHMHTMRSTGVKNMIVMWRDGRDVMVSWYHHCLFEQPQHNANFVSKVRSHFGHRDYDNVYKHLPDFIEYTFTQAHYPRFTWGDFVRQWHGRNDVVYARYEDLLTRPAKELLRICHALKGQGTLNIETATYIAEQYSFQNQTGRKAGDERKSNFLRKGIAGDWKNNFSEHAVEVFDFYAAKEMKLLGYQ